MESYLIKIKELSKPIVEEYGFILVDVKKVVEFGAVISQVIIDDPKTFTLDIDVVGEINQRILDEVNDFLPDDSYLEVTSLGIERELLSEEDYNKAIGQYVYVKMTEMVKTASNLDELYGHLEENKDNELIVKGFVKGAKKTFIIPKDKIVKIRLAVKF
jgi:ribosome maturation factor RimP